jgi:hypothetical protein
MHVVPQPRQLLGGRSAQPVFSLDQPRRKQADSYSEPELQPTHLRIL